MCAAVLVTKGGARRKSGWVLGAAGKVGGDERKGAVEGDLVGNFCAELLASATFHSSRTKSSN